MLNASFLSQYKSFGKFPALHKSLEEIYIFVKSACFEAGWDEESTYFVLLSVSEACTNIIEHAYHLIPAGFIECWILENENNLSIILHDVGKPFDPMAIPTPDLKADLGNRAHGGLGLYFINKMMDNVKFVVVNDADSQKEGIPQGNYLVMTKQKGELL